MLLPDHLADLQRSGLTDATIDAAGFYSVAGGDEIARLLNRDRVGANFPPCLVMPFRNAAGTMNGYARLRPSRPIGDGQKYLSPTGSKSRAFFPLRTCEAIATPGVPLGIAEGEKKALAADQCGLPCIGLSGIFNWQVAGTKPDRDLIPDLASIGWNRPVWIGFDFDARRNPNVNQAAAELARVLSEAGADVTIIDLPAGPRDADGRPTKMAVDDYLVAFGEQSLRSLIAQQIAPPAEPVDLANWRCDMMTARVLSLQFPAVYLDRSETGSGKTYADLAAMERVDKSLIVLPTHNLCRELEATCESRGIAAVAYPQLTDETCENYIVAERAIKSGLSPSQAVCPTCPFRDGCEYQSLLAVAEESRHKIVTHTRGSMTFANLVAHGPQFISIHEDAADFLRPALEVDRISDAMMKVCEAALYDVRERQLFSTSLNTADEHFYYRMLDWVERLQKILDTATETAAIEAGAFKVDPPRNCDGHLLKIMEQIEKWPAGETVRLVKALAAGEIAELAVVVDTIKTDGGKEKLLRRVVAVQQTDLPRNAAVWLADATADRDDVEILADRIGNVFNATPGGRLQRQHAIVQVPGDVTKATSTKQILAMLRGLLTQLPYDRIGVITHRRHVTAVRGTKRTGEKLEPGFQERIVRVEHFRGGDSRGSNEWLEDCDCLIVLGTPRVPPAAVRDRLTRLGMLKAAARLEDTTEWTRDYWSGFTADGRRRTVRTLAYRDHDWHRSYRAIVAAELTQAAGRGRACNDDGIPVVVVSTESLGYPLIENQPLSDSENSVIEAMKKISVSGQSATAEHKNKTAISDEENFLLSGQTPNIYYLAVTPLSGKKISSGAISEFLGKDRHWIMKVLKGLAERGLVEKIGERGGWKLKRVEMFDLYTNKSRSYQ